MLCSCVHVYRVLSGREPGAAPEVAQLGEERSTELSALVNNFILRRCVMGACVRSDSCQPVCVHVPCDVCCCQEAACVVCCSASVGLTLAACCAVSCCAVCCRTNKLLSDHLPPKVCWQGHGGACVLLLVAADRLLKKHCTRVAAWALLKSIRAVVVVVISCPVWMLVLCVMLECRALPLSSVTGCARGVLQADPAAAGAVRALSHQQCHAAAAVRQQGHGRAECHHVPQEAVQQPKAHL